MPTKSSSSANKKTASRRPHNNIAKNGRRRTPENPKTRKSDNPLILIAAGEPSGDRLAAALMAAMKAQRKGLRFIGVGGEEMQKQGLKSAFPMADLAVMGLAEVVPAIPRILARIRQLAALAQAEKPSLIITVDSQDFSVRLAKATAALGIPHIHYVCPKVWAWRRHRVKKLKHLYTHLLSNLPFEPPFFKQAGIPCDYVGHSATTHLEAVAAQAKGQGTHFSLALLPGSRRAEMQRHWPLFLATYRRLKKLHPQLAATLALPNQKALQTCQSLAPWGPEDAITPVYGEDRFMALATSHAALSKSGTNNLELALLNVPAVICYRMSGLTWAIARRLVKVKFISLPNLILNRCVYPEFIQTAATEKNLARALHPLLHNAASRRHQRNLLKQLQTAMHTPQPPAAQAAAIVLSYLK